MNNKKANILHENVIFIILNVLFLSILIFFIYMQGSSIHYMEEAEAKKVALLIDGARADTTINLSLENFFNSMEGSSKKEAVKINNEENIVRFKGSEDSFYEYGFFNDLDVLYRFDEDYLVLEFKDKVEEKNNEEKGENE